MLLRLRLDAADRPLEEVGALLTSIEQRDEQVGPVGSDAVRAVAAAFLAATTSRPR